jgi:23S rRNA (uracil1939-C5)-methyltransferase
VARHNGMAVFVPGTAPGDKVRAVITRRKKNYREARLLEILEPSADRITPHCNHASVCGGCTWQHLPYPVQLKIKEEQVRDHVERIAQMDSAIVQPIIGCEDEFYYRNKMEYSFGTRKWLTREEIEKDEFIDDSGLFAGLHAPGRFDKILNLNECHLQLPVSYQILDTLRSYCITNNIPAFDTINNTGYMRHLMIRNSHHTGELMVNLVTFKDLPDVVEKIAGHLVSSHPEITTVVNNVNDQTNPTSVGRIEHILYGPGTITDSIGGYAFQINPNSFFQTNTRQAETLYSVAASFADLSSGDVLYDLYCGVGTLTLFMSSKVQKVVGIELVDVAIENAKENAKNNNVENTEFILGDMKHTFNPELLSVHGQPDCIITDPPRSGMHPDVVRELINLKAPKMVYVSCNPSTMARDLKELKEVYRIEKIQPVDMFPQTYHIEAVAKLRLK